MRHFLLFVLLLVAWVAEAQKSYQVTDAQSKALAFVTILPDDDPTQGWISDIDGKFTLDPSKDFQFISFRYVGYKTRKIDKNDLSALSTIILEQATYQLTEALVIAGENPAHAIIRKAVQNKDSNNPEKLSAYRCNIYNKLKADFFQPKQIDETIKKGKLGAKIDSLIQRRSDYLLDLNKDKHVFLMESLVERSFLAPRHLLERILNNRISGFQSPSFSALIHSLQPFSFYEDYLSVLDQQFLNPLSKNSEELYYFEIQDTIINGQDTIFAIGFRPRTGKIFEGLQGVLQIHTNKYALYSIRAQPATPGALRLTIEQLYQLQQGHWFPHQLNIEIEANKYPSQYLGTRFSGRSYIDQIEINAPLRRRDFPLDGIELVKGSADRADSTWQKIRTEPLSKSEAKTYQFLDSLGAKEKVDRNLKIVDALFQGRYPLGKLDWDLTQTFKSNYFEGLRPGIRLVTNDELLERLRFSGYAGYGLRDKDWKYNAAIEWDVAPRREGKLNVYYKKDVLEPARFEMDQPGEFLTSRVYASRVDVIERIGAGFGGYFLPYTFSKIQVERQQFEPQYEYVYWQEATVMDSIFSIVEISGKIRYAFGEKFTQVFGTRIRERSKFPSLQLEYRQSLPSSPSDISYQQLLASIESKFQISRLGKSEFSLMAGQAWGQLPLPKLFSSSGLGNNFGLLIDELGFRTMQPYEFLNDRFIFLFIKQEFGHLVGRKGFFRPSFSIEQNMGIGTLKQPEFHRNIDFRTMEHGYLESGLVIDNIISLNYFSLGYVGFGLGAFYRYGAYQLSNAPDNWAFKITLSFEFL